MSRANANAERDQQGQGRRGQQRRRTKPRWQGPREPKELVTSAGHPLDPGVRREMESRLGHDFSQVRVHTDRDAATLTDLLGAEAVAVGRDIFFAEGSYHPETTDGRRLLAHELLHTAQVPDAGAALRAGRGDVGEVSEPLQEAERQAEEAAARYAERDGGEPAGEVGPEENDLTDSAGSAGSIEMRAQPASWLRYARVSADQQRAERLDPAQVVDRLVSSVLRSLRGDPTDASHRVRLHLERMAPDLRSEVLDKLEVRLPTPEYRRVLDLVEQGESELEVGPVTGAETPEPVVEGEERLESERETNRERERDEEQQERVRERDRDEEHRQEREREQEQEEPERERERTERERDERDRERSRKDEQENEGEEKKDKNKKEEDKKEQEGKEKKQQEEGEKEGDGEQARDEKEAAESGRSAEHGQAAGARAARGAAGQPQPGALEAQKAAERQSRKSGAAMEQAGAQGAARVDEDRASSIAEDPQGPLERHGLAETPGGDEERQPEQEPVEEEQPLGLDPGALADIVPSGLALEPAEQEEREQEQQSPGPEAYLPDTDIDVSGVPTFSEQLQGLSSGGLPKPQEPPDFGDPPPVEIEPGEEKKAERAERDAAEEERFARADEELAPRKLNLEPLAAMAEAPAREPAPEPENEPAAEKDTAAGGAAAGSEGAAEPGPTAEQAATAGPDPGRSMERAEPDAAAPEPGGPAGPTGAAGPGPREAAPATGPAPGPRPDPAGVQAAMSGAGPATATEPGPAPGPATEPRGTAETGRPAPGEPGSQPLPQDASLEPGGGACAGTAQPSTGEAGGGKEGCCTPGGGEGKKKEEQQPEPPEVSGQPPESALATTAQLPPHQMPETLNGVDKSVQKAADKERGEVKGDPPRRKRPVGAPRTLHGKPDVAAPASYDLGKVEKAPAKGQAEKPEVEGGEVPEGEAPGSDVKAPDSGEGWWDAFTDWVSAAFQKFTSLISDLPTHDPELNTTVGAAPKTTYGGESDPERTDRQKKALDDKNREVHGRGREDAAKPLGEDQIYPDVPDETLTADVSGKGGEGGDRGGGKDAAAGGGRGAGVPPEALSTITRQERGPQIQAGFAQGQSKLGQERKKKNQKSSKARAQHAKDVANLVAQNSDAQAGERAKMLDDAGHARAQWRQDQDDLIAETDDKATKKHTDARRKLKDKRKETDKKVDDRTKGDNKKIDDKRKEAEKKASDKKEEAENKDKGFFERAWDAVKSFFNEIKNAIVGFFEWAREQVTDIINTFKKWAVAAIEAARKFAVAAINVFADALIALGNVVLAAFPELQKKWRNWVNEKRNQAINKVNELADNLKKGVKKLLDALGGALISFLNVMEAGMLAAVDLAASVVKGALDFVKGVIQALGQWAALIGDIATDPGAWIANLGSAVKNGTQNYLFCELKSAIKEWFNNKVQEILGLPKTVFKVLLKGCLSMAQIARMAWEAVLASLPMIIAEILIKKVLVKLINIGAGAVMAIIEALKAAWGALSEIVAAFGTFMKFLQSVEEGGRSAACLFAKAVAAGAVALIDFIANWLLSGIGKYVKGVARKLQGIAKKVQRAMRRRGKDKRNDDGREVNNARHRVRNSARNARRNAERAADAMRRGRNAGRDAARHGPPGRTDTRRPGDALPDRRREREPAGRADTGPDRGGPDRDTKPDRDATPDRTDRDRGDENKKDRDQEEQESRDRKDAEKPTDNRRQAADRARNGVRNTARNARTALTRVRRAIGNGIRSVRRALRRLGGRFANSPLGRALSRAANRLRNLMRRMRQRFQERRDRREEQQRNKRDERNREKNKRARLARIVAKIRPKLAWLLRKGVLQRVLRPTLGAMRSWYRLTSLTDVGFPNFGIVARLNPSIDFIKAVWRNPRNEFEARASKALSGPFDDLPNDFKMAVLKYTIYGIPFNRIWRGEDPSELLRSWRRDKSKRTHLLEAFGGREPGLKDPGSEPTLRDIMTASQSRLTSRQLRLVREVVNSKDPDAALRKLLRSSDKRKDLLDLFGGREPTQREIAAVAASRYRFSRKQWRLIRRIQKSSSPKRKMREFIEYDRMKRGQHERLSEVYGYFPEVAEVLDDMAKMDEAVRSSSLPMEVTMHRGLARIDFMRGFAGDPHDLKGTQQTEPALMSGSVDRYSAFSFHNYQMHVTVPKGARGLWVGLSSAYPRQREFILPPGTEYEITDVRGPSKKGKFDIYATVLLPRP